MSEDPPPIPTYTQTDQPAESEMQRLRRLAVEMIKLKLEVGDLETQLTAKKEELKKYEEGLVPDMMREIGLTKLGLAGGGEIVAEPQLFVNFPKDPEKREAIFAKLRESGDDGMIKNVVTVTFARDTAEEQSKLKETLDREGFEFDEDRWIESSTYAAYLRRRIEQQENFPLKEFGAFQKTVAKVKLK